MKIMNNLSAKWNLILLRLGRLVFSSKAYHTPTKLQLETSGVCNFRCKQCALTNMKIPEDSGILNYGNFCKIVDEFKYLEYIEPYGLGECLLNKDLFNMLDYLKRKNERINIDITTNGSLINEEIAEKIVNLGIQRINYSLDGANQEAYENIRKGANFNQVVKNIRLLIDTRERLRKKSPKIVISLVIMEENIEKLVEYVELGKNLHVDEVRVQGHNLIWNKNKSPLKKYRIDENINKAIGLAEKLGIKFIYPKAFKVYASKSGYYSIKEKVSKILVDIFYKILYHKSTSAPIRCKLPWEVAYITNRGYVTPCCMIADYKIKHFGNILERPFIEIWNCKEFKEFRYEIATGNVPEICKYCFESRQGYYNERIQ